MGGRTLTNKRKLQYIKEIVPDMKCGKYSWIKDKKISRKDSKLRQIAHMTTN